MASDPHLTGEPSRKRAMVTRIVEARLDANPRAQRIPVPGAAIWHCPDFLSAQECTALIRQIDEDPFPSKLYEPDQDPEFRTSATCDLKADAVLPIDDRLSHLLGIPYEYGEGLQGQRYSPGQQFRAHCDYFREGQAHWDAIRAQGGHRTFTAMVYLNEVESGGATFFPLAGIRITPRPGLLIVWNNMVADGRFNYRTLHEGERVTAGTKYIVTKWYREDPWNRAWIAPV
jgi:prolyl 4-hydroxylase